MKELIQTEINLHVPLWVLLAGLTLIVFVDPYIRREKRHLMLIGIALAFFLLFFECIGTYSDLIAPDIRLRTVADFFTYTLKLPIIVIFCRIVDIRKKHIGVWIVVVINTLVFSSALFGSHLAFWIGEDYCFYRGPLGYTSHVAAFILISYFLCIAFRELKGLRNRELLIPLSCSLLILIAAGLDSFAGELRFLQLPLIYPAIVISCLFLYVWLHIQFAREHEKDMVMEQRARILVSQIKHHFIFNSLTVIKAYLDEPGKAEEALENFAGFLRSSIDFLDTEECIDAKKELETVEHFLYLEKERFGEKLTVETDLRDTDFRLPAFTIQTLVENAISHGIRKKEGGAGRLIIKTYRTEEAHVIEVKDDGPGFGREAEMDAAEHRHIGLTNTRERLRLMCDGEVIVESCQGKGTAVYVRIPKKSKGRDR